MESHAVKVAGVPGPKSPARRRRTYLRLAPASAPGARRTCGDAFARTLGALPRQGGWRRNDTSGALDRRTLDRKSCIQARACTRTQIPLTDRCPGRARRAPTDVDGSSDKSDHSRLGSPRSAPRGRSTRCDRSRSRTSHRHQLRNTGTPLIALPRRQCPSATRSRPCPCDGPGDFGWLASVGRRMCHHCPIRTGAHRGPQPIPFSPRYPLVTWRRGT